MIYHEKDYDECFKDEWATEPEILSDGDEFSEHFGVDYVPLTDEHIKALQQGKTLWVDINDGEYSCLLKKDTNSTVGEEAIDDDGIAIEEAIEHAEEAAEKQRELFKLCPIPSDMCDPTKDCASLKNGKNRGCLKCAKEYEQVAKWLTELKSLKEKAK